MKKIIILIISSLLISSSFSIYIEWENSDKNTNWNMQITTTDMTISPYELTKEEKLNWCKSYFDGCNTCMVENWEINACTEMYCESYKEPTCKEYEITDNMQNLLDHINGEIMYIWWSRYFDESMWKNDIDLMIKDIKNYTKLLKVDSLDEETKEKIEKEMERLKNIVDNNNEEWKMCWWIWWFTCADWYKCVMKENYPDASWVCVKEDIQISNPASIRCDELWWENYNIEGKNWQVWVCKFENWKICWAWEVFNWQCSKNFTIDQKRKQNEVYNVFEKHFNNKTSILSKQIALSYKIYEKVEKLTNVDNIDLRTHKLIINYIKKPLENYIKSNLKNYFNENIDDITSKDPVLGWSWYITDIEWIDIKKAKIYYEDGHIVWENTLLLKKEDNKLKVEIIN